MADRPAIPWGNVGKPLEELLRFEREQGHHELAGYSLLSTLVHEPSANGWRSFLLEGVNFEVVVSHLIDLARSGSASPKDGLDSVRGLVEAARTRRPHDGLIGRYLTVRQRLTDQVRREVDRMIVVGQANGVRPVVALASEVMRLTEEGLLDARSGDVFDHWYRRILEGAVPEGRAGAIPVHVVAARDRLLAHAGGIDQRYQNWLDINDGAVDTDTIYSTYSFVFRSDDVAGAADAVIAAHNFKLQMRPGLIEPFLRELPAAEVVGRLQRLTEWMEKVNAQNFEGVWLTPRLVGHLAQPSDFESLLAELDHLRAETRAGRFRFENELQRDLDFLRFTSEHGEHFGGGRGDDDHYAKMQGIEELPPPREDDYELSPEHIPHARRAAYEAACFLQFMKEFRDSAKRDIVIVGNDRYGRQWVVEPLEEFLKDDFTLRYDRVQSHKSHRMSMPHEIERYNREGFPREFVVELNERMPHVVIVDARSPRGDQLMTFSRATRDYVNWFLVFNDIRAGGDTSKYKSDMSLPDHIDELKKWYRFVIVMRKLQQWVTPGPVYKVRHWAPILADQLTLGDSLVPRRDPDLASPDPLVVLANPMVYSTDGDDLPEDLRDGLPYYFDGPEQKVRQAIKLGYGPYGVETRGRRHDDRYVHRGGAELHDGPRARAHRHWLHASLRSVAALWISLLSPVPRIAYWAP